MKYVRILGLFILLLLLLWGAYYAWAYFNDSPDATTPAVAKFVDATNPNELVPDLVPLPIRDLKLERNKEGKMLLYFSTTYYNQGRGPVELRVDDVETNIQADIERQVMQRIYDKDGGYRDAEVGTFLWHLEHLHYHFDGFVEYDLEAVDAAYHDDLKGSRMKSSFCIRDVSRVDLPLPNRKDEGEYLKCDKNKQGVSVGWGDTYYWDYPSQNIDISSLGSGTYRFITRANPDNSLEEINYENNISTTLFKIDMEKATVEVLEEIPANTPAVEHVNLEDPFGI